MYYFFFHTNCYGNTRVKNLNLVSCESNYTLITHTAHNRWGPAHPEAAVMVPTATQKIQEITLLMETLHLLPLKLRNDFKIFSLSALKHISHPLTGLYRQIWLFRSPSMCLLECTETKSGEGALCHYGAACWPEICDECIFLYAQLFIFSQTSGS